MRTGLNIVQTNILDSNAKTVTWLFEVTLNDSTAVDYYWGTSSRTWDSNTYTFKINNFSKISMSGGNEAFGLQSPANITIDVINADNSLDPVDFNDASIEVKLIMKANLPIAPSDMTWEGDLEDSHLLEREILSWTFKVKTANSVNKILSLECEDFLQSYLEGDYPNLPLVKEVFPTYKMADDNYCVPEIYGECFFPLRWTKDNTDNFYVLGSSGTYTVSELRSPPEWGGKSVWLESDPANTFNQLNKTGTDSNTYKGCEFLVVDTTGGGAGDSNAIFGNGDPFLDALVRMSNSSTVSTTNPIEIIRTILLNFGIPSAMIDNDAYTTAYNTWSSRGLTFKCPLYYKQSRRDLLSKLLQLCDTRLVIRDKLYFKVNSADSQHTLTKNWITRTRDDVPGTFKVNSISSSDQEDGCYITYATSGEPITSLVKVKVPAYTSSTKPSTNNIEAEYINDSASAQKIGILNAQKLYNRSAEISGRLKSKSLQIEVGDVITIEPEDYDAIGGSYNVLITRMSIGRNCEVEFIATKFKHPLRDWDDLSPSSVTPETESITTNFTQVISGTSTPGIADGYNELNVVNGVLRLGGTTGHVLLSSPDKFISIGSPPPTSFGNYEGVWLGISSGYPKLSLYKDADNYMQYDPNASPALQVKAELYPTGSSDAFSKTNDTLASISGTLADIAGDLDDITDGGTYSRIKTASTQNGDILLASVIGDIDDVDDGSTYAKVLATSISAGKIIMAQIDGDLDDISNGSSYGKVNLTSISAGKIILSETTGDIDDIDDGSTYAKVLATDISSGHIVLSECVGDLDDIDNGSTYSRVLATNISAGTILLSSQNSVAEGTLSGNSRVILSTSGLSCYNGSGVKTIEIKTDGDVKIGDYDNDHGLFYDNSEGDFIFKTDQSGNFKILGGGDIELTGDDSDPGRIIFKGTGYNTEIGSDTTGNNFIIQPTTAGYHQILYLGSLDTWWGDNGTWLDIELLAYRNIYVLSEYSTNFNAGASALSTSSTGNFMIAVNEFPNACSYSFRSNVFYPTFDKEADLGKSDHAWDDAYADDFNNVADFFYMDDMKDKDGNISTLDDIETIKAIKPSNEFDPRTGLRLIDDDTIPEFLLSKDKKTGEILYDHYDNITYCEMLKHNSIIKVPVTNKGPKKPYLSLKTMLSLCMGAIRQLSDKNDKLREEIEKIKKER